MSKPREPAAAAGGWQRILRRRAFRHFVDRTARRRLVFVMVTIAAIGLLAAAKGLIGYYVFAQKSTRIEVALVIVALVAGAFAIGERRLANAIEARFSRNTKKHRDGLAALADEIALITDRGELERRLVARFDELFGTAGTILFVSGKHQSLAVAAHSRDEPPAALEADDPLVVKLRETHAPVAPADVGSSLSAPLAWPLRVRGHVVGVLASGEHEYIESFDVREVEAISALADAAAADLALLDPALVPSTGPRTAHNLPPTLDAFVGRTREVAQCRELLAEARLVTLTGFGGAGKSRLAQRVAEELLPEFDSGVWWVDLANARDTTHVVSVVAAAVGVPEAQGITLTEQLVHRFGERKVLIVLDTCEHLREGCADLASGLLRGCPRLAILATSQEPLGVAGERELPLAALALPDIGERDATALGANEAVALFVDRARRAVPDFAPDGEALATVADIVRQLDGIPLAVELAAARVKVLSLAAIRDHLSDRFRLLAGGNGAVARHATMRASIEWTYDHLSPDEQQLLRRLSVFAGGFSLAAAADVAAPGKDELDLADATTHLVDKSLLRVERNAAGEPRHDMLATLRQFAQEKLAASGEEHDVCQRHLDHYVALAEASEHALHHRGAARALAALDLEFDNLMAAHAWCRDGKRNGSAALRLANALALYWLDRGLLGRGAQVYREALRNPDAARADKPRAEVLLAAARHGFDAGDLIASREYLAECLGLVSTLGAVGIECRALALEGEILQRGGDAAAGQAEIERAVALARTLGDASVLREALDDLGELHRNNGALSEAAAALDESLALARSGDDLAALHLALRDAARLAVERRDLDRAASLLREALDHALGTGARFDGENDLEVAGELAAAREDWPRAARYAGAAEAAATAMGSGRANRDDAITAGYVAAARAALGNAAYDAAYTEGQQVRLADALAEARAGLPVPGAEGA